MLRALQHNHIKPIISCGQVTSAGTAATRDIGGADFSAGASASSVVTLTRNIPPIRPGIVIGQAGSGIADGGYCAYNTDPTSASVVMSSLAANGSADDGTFDWLAVDYRNNCTDRVSPIQSVLCTSAGMRIIAVRVASNAVAEGQASISNLSVASSVYTFTFKNAFARTPLVFCTGMSSAQRSLRVTAKSASGCTITSLDSSELADDTNFYMLVVGWDRTADIGLQERTLHVPNRKPRLEVFRISGSGTAALALGSTDATLVDNGTGDYSLTFTKPFLRAPVVIATAKAGRAQLNNTPLAASIRVLSFNAAGAAADDDISLFVLGYDVASE